MKQKKTWNKKIDTMTENVLNDPCTIFNSRNPKNEEVKAILQACYEDTVIDF